MEQKDLLKIMAEFGFEFVDKTHGYWTFWNPEMEDDLNIPFESFEFPFICARLKNYYMNMGERKGYLTLMNEFKRLFEIPPFNIQNNG